MTESLGRAVLELDVDGGRFTRDLRSARTQAQGFVSQVGAGFQTVGRIAGIAAGGVAAIGTVAATKAGFGFNQMRQQAEIAFTTMLGDGRKARAFLDDLQQFAAKTPFEFSGLVESSQKLLAMGFAAKDVIPTMTAIGDAVAALGGDAGTLDRVTTALGQIQAKGKASAEEMLQLTEAGIPAWQFLADAIGTSVPEAMKLVSKGAVDAKTTVDAVTKGMEKRFGGMMEKQSHTFSGLWSTVKDTFDQISGAVMKPFFDLATKGLQAVVDRLPGIQKAVDAFMRAPMHRKLEIVWEGVKDAGKSLLSALQKAIGLVNWAAVWSKASGIAEGLANRFRTIDWSRVGATIGDGIADALAKTLAAGQKLAKALSNMVNGVDWVSLGRAMGPGLAAAVAQAFVTLTDPSFWIHNWDLALAVGLVAFGGSITRSAGKIGVLLARPFGDAVLATVGAIERLSPRLADAVLRGLLRLPGMVSGLFSSLIGPFTSLFARLGTLAQFTIKVLGVQAVIDSVVGLATRVVSVFRGIASSVIDALGRAWDWIKQSALIAALAVIEPFSHIPWKGGQWARDLKDQIHAQLDQIHGSAAAQRIVDEFNAKVEDARRAGASLGAAISAGIQAEVQKQVPLVGGILGRAVAGMVRHAHDHTGSTTEDYAGRVLGAAIGRGTAKGMTDAAKVLGPTLGKLIAKAVQDAASSATGAAKTVATKGMSEVGQLIVAAAKKYGVDARAAMAVAMTEGGLKWGAVGDAGHSFGPFQMADFGELSNMSTEAARKFANSVAGINFALRRMAEEGAKGKVGLEAIKQIVGGPGWGFERPANSAAEVAKAFSYFQKIPGQLSATKPQIAKASQDVMQSVTNAVALYVGRTGTIVGLANARAIAQGVLQGKPEMIAATIKAFSESTTAAAQAAGQAFSNLATQALAAFDAKMAAWVPPSQRILDKMQLKEQIQGIGDALNEASATAQGGGAALAKSLQESVGGPVETAMSTALGKIAGAKTLAALDTVSRTAQTAMTTAITNATAGATAAAQTAVTEAQAALTAAQAGGDPDAIAAAQQALDTAVQNQNALNAAIQGAIETGTGLLIAAETTRHDQLAATARTGVQKRITAIGEELAKEPEKWNTMGAQVGKVLAGYNVKLEKAGVDWVAAFAKGIRATISQGVAAMRDLAAAIAAELPSVNSPLQPAKRGPLAFHPFDMGRAWGSELGAGLRAGRIGDLFGNLALGGDRMGAPAFAAASGSGMRGYDGPQTIQLVLDGQKLAEWNYTQLIRRAGRNVTIGLG